MLQSVGSGGGGGGGGPPATALIIGNFEPGFFVEHFLKDMGIAARRGARRMQLSLPGLGARGSALSSCRGAGHTRKGTQALLPRWPTFPRAWPVAAEVKDVAK